MCVAFSGNFALFFSLKIQVPVRLFHAYWLYILYWYFLYLVSQPGKELLTERNSYRFQYFSIVMYCTAPVLQNSLVFLWYWLLTVPVPAMSDCPAGWHILFCSVGEGRISAGGMSMCRWALVTSLQSPTVECPRPACTHSLKPMSVWTRLVNKGVKRTSSLIVQIGRK